MTQCSAPTARSGIWPRPDGQDQLFRMAVGGQPAQVSSLKGDIAGFKVSADGSRLIVWADRDLQCADFACEGLPKAQKTGSGRVYDQLFVRHWDTWAEPGVRSRIFAFPIANGQVDRRRRPGDGHAGRRHAVQAVRRRRGDRHLAPTAAPSISRCAKRAGSRPSSTNLDIFAAPADGSAQPTNLTPDNDGTDNLPALSPDGRSLAYFSMARPTYEADRQVLMVRDLASGQVRAVTANWDRSVGSIAWAKDGKSIIVDCRRTRWRARCSGSMSPRGRVDPPDRRGLGPWRGAAGRRLGPLSR